jgi:hypothetical protein
MRHTLLNQDQVDALADGTEVLVRWPKQRQWRTYALMRDPCGRPAVREIKASGFPTTVPLAPVGDDAKRVRVALPSQDEDDE